ncbi:MULTISPECIES: hypothetical protein [Caballeronia]|jgi:hypothetical protein|uniref:hypothetical protein n=1 Tax=Caballeronia TaxID=1827195 RepID=UPI001FD2674C|nr:MULTISPECIES: hypothetical protein [Caballeronia]
MSDKLIADLRTEVAAALEALEGLVITVDFDSEDPDSVEAAIEKVEATIDATVAPYRGHPLIESAVADLKAECREGLYKQAERAAPITPGITTKPTLH